MSERKKIDRLFQENFRDFEVTPDEKVWQNIEAELKEKKKRRVIPIWWKLAGVAAVLILGLLIFNRFSNSGHATQNEVVNTENNGSGNENNNGGKTTGNQNNNENTNGAPNTESQLVNKDQDVVNPNTDNQDNANQNGSNLNQNASHTNKLMPNAVNNAVAVSPSAGNPNQKLHEREINTNPNPKGQNQFGLKKPTLKKSAGDAFAATPVRKESGDANPEKPLGNAPNQGVADNGDKKTNQALLPDNGLNESNTRQTNQINNTNDKLEVQSPQAGIAANNAEVKKDSAAVATAEPNALEELLNEKENNVTSREQKINRWQITSSVAPIYFSSVSQGSPLDSRFEGNRKSYTPSLSFGVGAKYAVNKKFAIKSGVNAVNLEYNTTDVVFFQTENARMIENVKPNLAGSFVQVENEPGNNAVTTLGRTRNQYKGEVNQKIGYVEVPVEMSYQLVDKKFGMEVIGGLSTLILNKNEISLLSPGLNMNIGEADNLNTVHFSTNVGMGFRYNFLKSFQANVEPMFKYQINTFSNDSGNFKPFLFGIYTGVSYKF
jgi:hypothetical protein